jgi:hypothetical protein
MSFEIERRWHLWTGNTYSLYSYPPTKHSGCSPCTELFISSHQVPYPLTLLLIFTTYDTHPLTCVVSSYLGIWVFHKAREMQTLRFHDSCTVKLDMALLETEISTKTWHELNLVPSCLVPLQNHKLTCMKLVILWRSHAWRSFTRSESWEFLFSSLWVFQMFCKFFLGEFASLVRANKCSVCSCWIPATRKSILERRSPHQNQSLIPYCKTFWTTIKKRMKPNKAPF